MPVYFVERNVHGALVVYGMIGVRQYYGYTQNEAIKMYKDEWRKTEGQFICQTERGNEE